MANQFPHYAQPAWTKTLPGSNNISKCGSWCSICAKISINGILHAGLEISEYLGGYCTVNKSKHVFVNGPIDGPPAPLPKEMPDTTVTSNAEGISTWWERWEPCPDIRVAFECAAVAQVWQAIPRTQMPNRAVARWRLQGRVLSKRYLTVAIPERLGWSTGVDVPNLPHMRLKELLL
jgi:hypothetical protein